MMILYKALVLLLIALIVTGIFGVGYKVGENNSFYVGCWRDVSDSERAITIRVEGRQIKEIINTCRHELCHEIDYRIRGETSDNETFANECKPEDYIWERLD